MMTRHIRSRTQSVPLLHVLLAVAVLGAACDVSDATAPTAPSPVSLTMRAATVHSEAIDISGSWTWSDIVTTTFPAEIAEILGIQAEGAVTHATCEAGGTMSIAQTGDTFQGTATQASRCTTRGGQQIVSPFPPTIEIVDGRIAGRSLHFLFGGQECPFQAVVSVSDGVAVALEGTGKCAPEVHPGLLKSVNWRAAR
jgi:hypothetical protein